MTDVGASAHPQRTGGAGKGNVLGDGRARPTSWLTSNLPALGLAVVVAVVAIGALAGWALGWPLLTSWLPGEVRTKVNAGTCLLLLAAALALLAAARRGTRTGRLPSRLPCSSLRWQAQPSSSI